MVHVLHAGKRLQTKPGAVGETNPPAPRKKGRAALSEVQGPRERQAATQLCSQTSTGRYRAAACLPLWPNHAQSHQHLLSANSNVNRTGTTGAGATPNFTGSCAKHKAYLFYLGWRESESKAQQLEEDQPLLSLPQVLPARNACHDDPSHTGAARRKWGTGNTTYPSQDPSARCFLRQKSRPFCRVSLHRKEVIHFRSSSNSVFASLGAPSAPLRL